MKSKSFSVKNIQALNTQLDQVHTEGFKPTVAIVFSAVCHKLSDLSSAFGRYNIDLVGCSSAGEIHKGKVIEEGIVVLLMEMQASYFKIQTIDTEEQSPYQMAHAMGKFAVDSFENPAAFVFSGGIAMDSEQVIFGMKDGARKEIPIYGGAAGDDLSMTKTLAFSNNWISDNGLVCMVVDTEKISVTGLATSGWEAIGIVNTITKSEGNVIHAINEKPALDVFINYFGFFGNELSGGGPKLETISGQYPLQIMREGGYSILRSPLIADEKNRTLIMAGGVKEGDKFRFSISPGFEVIEKTIAEFGHLKDKVAEADAMFLISCKGRHTALGPMVEDEIQGIHNYWNAPMVGFFAYGEIGNMKNGTCEFHNETCVMVILKEK